MGAGRPARVFPGGNHAARGNTDVAPEAKITSINSRETSPTWSRKNLTDLAMPIGLPVKPDGSVKLGWHSLPGKSRQEEKSVAVDLGRVMPIDEVRLLPAWREDVFGWKNYGMPARFVIEAAKKADFSDARRIYDRREHSLISPGQNIQSYAGGGVMARYLRVRATRMRDRNRKYFFALGELQVYSGGENRALGCGVMAGESLQNALWGRAALTDGQLAGGKILELPQWMDGLEKAHALTQKRDSAVARLLVRRVRAERNLLRGSAGAAVSVVFFPALWGLARATPPRAGPRKTPRAPRARFAR